MHIFFVRGSYWYEVTAGPATFSQTAKAQQAPRASVLSLGVYRKNGIIQRNQPRTTRRKEALYVHIRARQSKE